MKFKINKCIFKKTSDEIFIVELEVTDKGLLMSSITMLLSVKMLSSFVKVIGKGRYCSGEMQKTGLTKLVEGVESVGEVNMLAFDLFIVRFLNTEESFCTTSSILKKLANNDKS